MIPSTGPNTQNQNTQNQFESQISTELARFNIALDSSKIKKIAEQALNLLKLNSTLFQKSISHYRKEKDNITDLAALSASPDKIKMYFRLPKKQEMEIDSNEQIQDLADKPYLKITLYPHFQNLMELSKMHKISRKLGPDDFGNWTNKRQYPEIEGRLEQCRGVVLTECINTKLQYKSWEQGGLDNSCLKQSWFEKEYEYKYSDFFSSLLNQENHEVKNKQILLFAKSLIKSLKDLHTQRIYHGNIRPQTIVFEKNRENLFVPLLRKVMFISASANVKSDNIIYFSPEMLSHFFESTTPNTDDYIKNDYWALGLVLYCVYYNKTPPFFSSLIACWNKFNAFKDVLSKSKNSLLNDEERQNLLLEISEKKKEIDSCLAEAENSINTFITSLDMNTAMGFLIANLIKRNPKFNLHLALSIIDKT